MDFSKLFNRVSHNILLNKLSYFNIKQKAWNWLSSYITEREQCVEIHHENNNDVNKVTSKLRKC